jgi:hypothetical protein
MIEGVQSMKILARLICGLAAVVMVPIILLFVAMLALAEGVRRLVNWVELKAIFAGDEAEQARAHWRS